MMMTSRPGTKEMNNMKNRKVHNSNTPVPGCLGRMVNLFDINPGLNGNKRIMDKPHYDGSSLSRSRSDVARSLNPIEDPLEDKLIVSELGRKASNRTPMKMLLDHEMSKEVEPKQNPPNLVAKLMGLDALPRKQNNSVVHLSQSKIRGTNSALRSESPVDYRQTDSCIESKQRKPEANHQEQKEYKDIYEIWNQAEKDQFVKDESPQRSRHLKDLDEKRMALVRQKFVEAKRLVTDERLRQTKEFHDALEVLSSNQDLFLKCLQEPNSQFTQQLYEMYAIPLTPETKRITVLKPSKFEEDEKFSMPGKKIEKQAKKFVPAALAHGRSKSNDERSSTFSYWDANDPLPTRIVVLKPSIGNAHEIGTLGSSDSSSLKTTQGEDYFTETEVCDAHESREVTRQMLEKMVGRQSDDTLHSSVFSNGYTGDESSINKSDNEYDGESDSEVMSPTSRHSWDYINRFNSPFSSSSFSRASCSPESSVCREAKKRLSERWAMVALHGNPPEQRHVRRGSSTLGEMLALSDTKKSLTSEHVRSNEEARGSISCIARDLTKEESILLSPRSLLRSKSVPVSSSVYGSRLNVELSGPEVGKPNETREEVKPKSNKTSFKGKVSSLFFSKTKKVKKAASNVTETETERIPPISTPDTPELCTGKSCGNTAKLVGSKASDEGTHLGLQGQNEAIATSRVGLSVRRSAKSNDNQDHPSPISVLETPFGEDDTLALEFASNSREEQGAKALARQLNSNLIDKSPPIGSISRTISWKDSCSDTATKFPVTPPVVPLGPETEEDWSLFVHTLLTDTGINDEAQSDTFFTRWHSPDSPLDPKLRENYINLNNKALAHEANRRQWRSSRKLMYDCVNAALADISQYRLPERKHRPQAPSLSSSGHSRVPLTDEVWTRIKEWVGYDARWVVGDDGDRNTSLLVEMVVKNEVVGSGLVANMRVEIDKVGKEIEEKLLEELVEDAVVVALTGRVS
uniref:DUF3741 domain-containing protein n=1 Tax=Kalanchoe fedtschenkoi TaxID=63787 RepID=A0A7N0SYN6_KALFE